MIYPQSKARNMWTEFKRVMSVCIFNWQSTRSAWRMASIRDDHLGRPHRPILCSDGTFLKDPDKHNQWSYQNSLYVKRDYFDWVWDFLADRIGLVLNNVFVVERCNHPHDEVIEDWDGDSEVGYIKQVECRKCRGYLGSRDDVDRYLPADQRKPDMIREYAMPKNKPYSASDEGWNDLASQMGDMADDYERDAMMWYD